MSDATVEPRSLSAEAIFISHATADKDFVRVLVRQLKQKGFEVWHQDEMAVGRNYMAEIDARLDSCKAGIVVWSRASVSSEYVIAEATGYGSADALFRSILRNVSRQLYLL